MSRPGSDVAIPRSIDEITPTWLTAALKAGGHNVHVASLDVAPIGVGVGIMSLVFRLTPTYDEGAGPASLVAMSGRAWSY